MEYRFNNLKEAKEAFEKSPNPGDIFICPSEVFDQICKIKNEAKEAQAMYETMDYKEWLLERILDTLIEMPNKMCDEMQKREEIRKIEVKKQIEKQMEVYRENGGEINRMMYNCVVDRSNKNDGYFEEAVKLRED